MAVGVGTLVDGEAGGMGVEVGVEVEAGMDAGGVAVLVGSRTTVGSGGTA